MQLVLGYALAVLVGLALGLLGGGGSILTVPIFVYVMGYPAKSAIAMSLPVVGLTSLVGAFGHWRGGNVSPRTALSFGALAMVGAFAGARLSRLVPGEVQLTLLAVVMLGSATMMIRGALHPSAPRPGPPHPALRMLAALGVGLLTGVVGVGGGFLIVPALVLLAGMEMKPAIGTSLVVIAMNTASASLGYRGQVPLEWRVVAIFTAIAIAGSLVGTRLVKRVDARHLRLGFGAFLIVLAIYVLLR